MYPKWGAYNKNSCAFNIDVFLNDLKISKDLESILGPSTPSNNPPTVTITSPRNNATFEVGESINLQANASDPDGNLDKVNFKINGDFYKTDTDRPFENSFTPSQPGTYEIAAKAFDSEGLAKEVKVSIEVKPAVIPNRAPEVIITSPQDGAVFTLGETITLKASATDPDSNLDKVNFKINDNFYKTDSTRPFENIFTPESSGTYKISARAFDKDGLSREVTVNITVNETFLSTNEFFDNNSNAIKIYPVPATDVINVKGLVNNCYEVSIMDISGRILKNKTIFKKDAKINIDDLARGIYFINFNLNKKTKTLNFIKK